MGYRSCVGERATRTEAILIKGELMRCFEKRKGISLRLVRVVLKFGRKKYENFKIILNFKIIFGKN